MKIIIATDDFSNDVKSLFPEAAVLTGDESSADLVIFTGGEDIDPRLYTGMGDDLQVALQHSHINLERDAKEKKLFGSILSGEFKAKRILGICRGVQLINALLGGTLYYDLPTFGKQHPGIHAIQHIERNPFINLRYVNSLHHQGLRDIGAMTRRQIFQCSVYAIEPETGVPEIVHWKNNDIRIIGFQFHPEFWDDALEEKADVVQKIRDWM